MRQQSGDSKAPSTSYRAVHMTCHVAPVPKRRPLLRGWINVFALPYSILIANRVVLCAPTHGSAYAAILGCLCCGVGYAVSVYYHIVNHTPQRRAFVRKFDHAAIFVTILGIFTPLMYRAYELVGDWVLGLLVVEWLVAIVGMVMSIRGVVPKLTKSQRNFLYIFVCCMPALVPLCAFGWDVYRWNVLGYASYLAGALMYSVQWPSIVPGVFEHHEMFHVMVFAGEVLLRKGLEQAFLQY